MISFCECIVDQFKTSIDYIMVLDCIDAMGLSQQVHISRLLDQYEQCVFVDSANFTWAPKERAFLDWFDQSSCCNCVVILVSHNRWSLYVPSRNASCLKSDLAIYMSQLDHARRVASL